MVTPDGLGSWGDGRLTVLGTEGYLELRKYIDIAGRPGTDHLFLVDNKQTRYIDCSDAALPYAANLIADVLDRTELAMPQAHCFKVMELALRAGSDGDAIGQPSMSRQVRVAVIGAGIGAAHVEAYCANSALFQVAVVCDLDAARAGKIAASAGATVETWYDAVLRRDDVELIDICLPPSVHATAIEQALRAGRHVLCEKPLVGSLREVERIQQVAATAGRAVVPVYQYRYGNGLARLRRLIAAGVTGKPLVASIETSGTVCRPITRCPGAVERPQNLAARSSAM